MQKTTPLDLVKHCETSEEILKIFKKEFQKDAKLKLQNTINQFNEQLNIFGYSADDLRLMKKLRKSLEICLLENDYKSI